MNKFMAKVVKAVKEAFSNEEVAPVTGNIEIRSQDGEIVTTMSNVEEALAYAGENGYQITIR